MIHLEKWAPPMDEIKTIEWPPLKVVILSARWVGDWLPRLQSDSWFDFDLGGEG